METNKIRILKLYFTIFPSEEAEKSEKAEENPPYSSDDEEYRSYLSGEKKWNTSGPLA